MKLDIRQTEAPGKEKHLLPGLPGKKPGNKSRKWRRLAAAVVVVAVLAGGGMHLLGGGQTAAALETSYITAQVARMDITSSITGSGTLEAANSYSVTTLVEGTILTDTFEESMV